jgi:hypothetical protein
LRSPGPLHRRADAVAVAEVDVVAHPDLVSVVDDGAPGSEKRIACISSISSRPLSSSGARRRRMPRFSFIRGSFAYSAYM